VNPRSIGLRRESGRPSIFEVTTAISLLQSRAWAAIAGPEGPTPDAKSTDAATRPHVARDENDGKDDRLRRWCRDTMATPRNIQSCRGGWYFTAALAGEQSNRAVGSGQVSDRPVRVFHHERTRRRSRRSCFRLARTPSRIEAITTRTVSQPGISEPLSQKTIAAITAIKTIVR